MRQGGENTLQNICGLYVSVSDDGAIKRNLTVKSGETIDLASTTVNDEIIAFSELNFKYYAELLEHIENMCEDSYVEVTDGDFGEAGIDIDAYTEILKTVHKLIGALEESNPLHGTLLRTLLEDQLLPDDGSAMYLINSEAKITDCLSSVMQLQFLINDILYDLRSGTPLDMENKYSIFRSAEFTQIQTLGEKVTVQYRFRSLIDYYIFLMMRFIANQPNVTLCQCCGKYFIPKTKRTTLYCDRIIRNNKTCKQIAPALKHKRDAARDLVIEIFDRTKRKMYKRFERTNDFSKATANTLSLTQYYDWLGKAEQARNEYLAGKISAEEALEIITVE